MTRNEVRLEMGLKPMGYWVPADEYDDLSDEDRSEFESNMWNQPSDPTFVNQYAMANQPEGQDQPGIDDGFGGGEGDQDGPFPFGQPPGTGTAPQQPTTQKRAGVPSEPEPMAKASHRTIVVHLEN